MGGGFALRLMRLLRFIRLWCEMFPKIVSLLISMKRRTSMVVIRFFNPCCKYLVSVVPSHTSTFVCLRLCIQQRVIVSYVVHIVVCFLIHACKTSSDKVVCRVCELLCNHSVSWILHILYQIFLQTIIFEYRALCHIWSLIGVQLRNKCIGLAFMLSTGTSSINCDTTTSAYVVQCGCVRNVLCFLGCNS